MHDVPNTLSDWLFAALLGIAIGAFLALSL